MQVTIQKDKCRRSILNNMHVTLAIFVMLWLNSGVFSYISEYIPSLVKLLAFGIWLFLALYSNKEYAISIIKIELPILLLYFIIHISTLFTTNSVLVMYLKNIEYIMIITSMSVFYLKYGNDLDLKLICRILIFDLVYIGINTFIKLNNDPMVSRILSTGNIEHQEQLIGITDFRAIGSYTYFYLLVMMVLIVWKYWLHNNNKIILSVILISGIVLIIKSQFTIALILMFIFLIKMLLEKYINNKLRWGIIIISIIAIILFIDIIAITLDKMVEINIFSSSIINERIEDMSTMLKGVEISSTSDVSLRFEVYRQSLETFGKNIFIGSFGEDTIGGHSTWLDFLGLYGIFAILLYVFFYGMYKFTRKNVNDKNTLKNIWQYYCVLGLINTILFANMTLTIFVLIPIILKLEEKEIYEKNTMDS